MKKIIILAVLCSWTAQAQTVTPTPSATPSVTPTVTPGTVIGYSPSGVAMLAPPEGQTMDPIPTNVADVAPKEGAPTFNRPGSTPINKAGNATEANQETTTPTVSPSPTPVAFCSGEGEKVITVNRNGRLEELCLLGDGTTVNQAGYGKK